MMINFVPDIPFSYNGTTYKITLVLIELYLENRILSVERRDMF
jgi:hypothetical protein